MINKKLNDFKKTSIQEVSEALIFGLSSLVTRIQIKRANMQNIANVFTSKKSAFTLAEVLITIGIIGIVAALTIPSIVSKYKTQEAIARLKKFNSMMGQAILLSENENGPAKNWQKNPLGLNEDGSYDEVQGSIDTYDFFMNYLAKYMKYTKIEKDYVKDIGEPSQKALTYIYFADGSTTTLKNGGCIDFGYDVNGDKGPNFKGYDIFYFVLCTTQSDYYFGNKNTVFGTYMQTAMGRDDRSQVLEQCAKQNGAAYCGRLLELDEWEFKKDYPYKL